MTLLRWSLICALAALVFLALHWHYPPSVEWNDAPLGFYLPLTCSVILGTLGAFVFRNY